MILIVVKHQVRPEYADSWNERMAEFTAATRAEPGAISFDWARNLDDPNEFILVEAFVDAAAGAAHVQTEHCRDAIAALPGLLSAAPQIIPADIEATEWSTMREFVVSEP